MPVQMDSSIVPDSTISSSPPATLSVVKRARRTYGRSTHREAAGEGSDTPHLLRLSRSSSSINSVFRTGFSDVDEEVPPSSDPSHEYSVSNQADDDDDGADSEDASSTYQFSWKKKLKDIDIEEDNDFDMTGVFEEKSASKRREEGDASALSPQRHGSPDSARLRTYSVENGNDALTETALDESLSTLPSSSPATHSSFGRTPSPPVTNQGRRKKSIIHDSDSEDGENQESSPTTPSHPHPLTTPKSRSSPTPPTSDDDMPAFLGQDNKGKGKGKASSRADVAPLCFSGEPVVSFKRQKASEDKGSKRKKIKAPTKKELRETARNRLRIAADQQVSIPRTEAVTSKYTIQGLFEAIVPKRPEIEVDPIADFSSERHTSPVIPHIAPSPPTLRQSDGSPLKPSLKRAQNSPLRAMHSLPDLDNNSDEDFPEVGALVEKDGEAQESLKRQQKLSAIKQRAMEMQAKASAFDCDDEDDDDLQIVQAADMQMMIKEEEADRRSGRKKQVSEGRKVQLNLGGIGLTQRKAKESSLNIHDLELLQRAGAHQKRKGDPQMTPKLLTHIVQSRADAARQDIIRVKEEEWVQRGGRVNNQDDSASVQDVSKLYEKGLNLPGGTAAGMGMEGDDDGSDDEWSPELSTCLQGSASLSPTHGSDYENADAEEEGTNNTVNEHDHDRSEEEEELDIRLPMKTRRPVLKTVVDSDDEDIATRLNSVPHLQNGTFKEQGGISGKLNLEHRGSISSLEDRTDNEEDKENETSRMFDRGEDKENKAVVRHIPLDEKVPLVVRKSPLFGLGSGQARRLSMSPAHPVDDENNTLNQAIDEDPFASPSRPSRLPKSFEARLKLVSPIAAQPSSTPPNLTPFIGTEPKPFGFSQFLDEPSAVIVSAPFQSGFSDFFDSGTETQKTTEQSIGSVDKASPRDRFSRADALDLTQDITLQPAFEVNGTFLRKADQIFEKEQDFLTQTRPNVSSPEIYRRPSPTPVLSQSQPQLTSRRPLRTITLSDEVDFKAPAPLGRLHKRAKAPNSPLLESFRSSPSPSLTTKRSFNAFDVLQHGSKAQDDKFRRSLLDKSEFVEQEAQESDDDELFGFGPRLKDKDDEENEEDLDQTLETLVDDAEMDEKTLAADLVMEKYQEHEKEDDEALQKMHEAIAQGELRKKRKNRGLGMADSDDESDEDEHSRRIRRQMHKKQRIDRSNIKELGEREETRSFFNVYQQNLMTDDADFAYLQESQPLDIVMGNSTQDANEGTVDEAEGPREVLTITELTKLVRETAQRARIEEEEETLDPNDISWMDDDQSDDDNNVRVKPIDSKAKKHSSTRRKVPEKTEFDVVFEPLAIPPSKTDMVERSKKWAKVEERSGHYGTTGRNVGGAAVTGHQAKSGGGLMRNGPVGGSAIASANSESRRQVKAEESVILRMAAATRTTRFG